ncbi:hypothetical protein KC351_g32 [Hortaea werneckii]|nr:hypothetical protein KC351_g32 [Hortaea werneckii]
MKVPRTNVELRILRGKRVTRSICGAADGQTTRHIRFAGNRASDSPVNPSRPHIDSSSPPPSPRPPASIPDDSLPHLPLPPCRFLIRFPKALPHHRPHERIGPPGL